MKRSVKFVYIIGIFVVNLPASKTGTAFFWKTTASNINLKKNQNFICIYNFMFNFAA